MSDIQHKIKYFDIKNGGFIYSFFTSERNANDKYNDTSIILRDFRTLNSIRFIPIYKEIKQIGKIKCYRLYGETISLASGKHIRTFYPFSF